MKLTKKKYIGYYGIVINSKNKALLIRKAREAYKENIDLE